MNEEKLTETQLETLIRQASWLVLKFYDHQKIKDRLTDEQFDRCAMENPQTMIERYKTFRDRLSPTQFDYCVRKNTKQVLDLYDRNDLGKDLTDEQFLYCFKENLSDDTIRELNGRFNDRKHLIDQIINYCVYETGFDTCWIYDHFELNDQQFDHYVRKFPSLERVDLLNDEQFAYCVQARPMTVVANIEQFRERLTHELFQFCIRECFRFILSNYDKIGNKLNIDDELFDSLLRESPRLCLENYDMIKHRIDDEQFAYCLRNTNKQELLQEISEKDADFGLRLLEYFKSKSS